jgi:hypothetical protein
MPGFDYMKGIHTILTTPLHDDYDVDLDGLAANTAFGADSNAHALVCLGTQGEFPSFSTEERKWIIQTTVEADTNEPRDHTIPHVSNGTDWPGAPLLARRRDPRVASPVALARCPPLGGVRGLPLLGYRHRRTCAAAAR